MADKVFHVSVQTSKPAKVSVSSNASKEIVSVGADMAQYYSGIAEKWAIGEGLILGQDYSAKTYAQTAADYSEKAKIYADASSESLLETQNVINNGIVEINNASNDAKSLLETTKNDGVRAIETAQETGVNVVATATNNAISSIDTKEQAAIDSIEETIETVTSEIESVQTVADNITIVAEVAENLDDILNKTVDVGDTLTSEAGTEAKVVNVGTKFAPVLEFTIPQGAKGVDGKDGKDGVDGKNGADGKDGADGGMSATFEAETQTLSFYSENGTVLNPHWGNISGDITQQADLQAELAKYLKGVVLSQADYDALEVKDANTLYLIEE